MQNLKYIVAYTCVKSTHDDSLLRENVPFRGLNFKIHVHTRYMFNKNF